MIHSHPRPRSLVAPYLATSLGLLLLITGVVGTEPSGWAQQPDLRALEVQPLNPLIATDAPISNSDDHPKQEPDTPEPLTFERHVRPILKEHCFDCHGATEEHEGGLDLRLRRFLVEGGNSGPAITPASSDESLLVQRIRDGEMPPGEKKVTPDQLELVEKWIYFGAKTVRDEPEDPGKGVGITPEEREHWAFQPIRPVEVPEHRAADRVRTPIDAFLLAKLHDRGLEFSTEVDRRTWLRRAAFALTGLPPSSEELATFLADENQAAYERALDRLLGSPHYGERWGRYWLDIAGYADSDGVTVADAPRPYAYKYRDYVIRSLNADKPLNEFIVEQLAGDELVSLPYHALEPEQLDKLIATGFLRMAADGTGSGAADADLAKNQVLADTLKIVSTSLLGLTVQCAQCHDHRYDPISHEDYHRLRAIFEPAYNWKNWRTPQQRLVSLYTGEQRELAAEIEEEAATILAEKQEKQTEFITAALEKELEKYSEEQRDALRTAQNTPPGERTAEQQQLLKDNPSVNITPGVLYQYNAQAAEELKKFDSRITEVRSRKPVEDFLQVLTEVPGEVPETFLFYRGDHRQPRDSVQPGVLSISLQPGESLKIPENDPSLPTSGRRLAYARWLTSGEHPLLGRVLANRIWLHHFGQGLAGNPGDFGALGNKPTHPELLDWLARDLVEQGWSLKRMHKRIMLSTVYRQSSLRRPELDEIDSANQLYGRMPVRRLEAEAIRDAMLEASGELDRRLFASTVPVSEDDVGQVVTPADQPRRSIYLQVRRSKPVSFLASFDAPVMETNCEIRPSTTAAPQSLMLMNSPFILERAEQMARRLQFETDTRQGEKATEVPDVLVSGGGTIDLVAESGESVTSDAFQWLVDLRLTSEGEDELGIWKSSAGSRGPAGHSLPVRIAIAWQRAYQRLPTEVELRSACQFVGRQLEQLEVRGDEDPILRAMTNLCQALITSNEFLYVD